MTVLNVLTAEDFEGMSMMTGKATPERIEPDRVDIGPSIEVPEDCEFLKAAVVVDDPGFISLDELGVYVPVERISTGIDELDFMYGMSDPYPEGLRFTHEWGLPRGAISLWGGSAGVGKSRIAVEVAKKLAMNNKRVAYFTTETDVKMFANQKFGGFRHSNLFLSDTDTVEKNIEVIRKTKPHVVFLDSVNNIEDYNNGRGAKKLFKKYRDVFAEIGCHGIFITQLNQNGTLKGGTSPPHEVDMVYRIFRKKDQEGSLFTFASGDKNRYGKTGLETFFRHTEETVLSIGKGRFLALDDGDDSWYKFGRAARSKEELPEHHRVRSSINSAKKSEKRGWLSWMG